jgi:hypothetical protein
LLFRQLGISSGLLICNLLGQLLSLCSRMSIRSLLFLSLALDLLLLQSLLLYRLHQHLVL